MASPPPLPPALIWTVSGLALAGAVAIPLARPWRVPQPPSPPVVARAAPTPLAPPANGALADALTRVLGAGATPRTAPSPPPAGGLVLEGTVVEPGASRALVRAPGELRVRVLAVGEVVGDWTLASVGDGEAAFTAGPARVELHTPRGRAAADAGPEGTP